ncbi:RNA polymerase subunit sigma-24 [Frankia sp. AgPm24]|uniref:RNA polymerase subunit sigma-24 n=1 Tax=Frankia sp. AgPm24 TaxID=631128 RepID=UPI00200F3C92|nr:RNA polymerase subunit sigma-24 [Frankia sp. AgPm24]MCK9925002.1 RNA polymerase subunit sigma-24 [Frankia sp. AgPm24]
MDDDADLVARVRSGDRLAFDDLYDLYADDVFSMCLLILGDPTVARAAAGTAFALVARTRLNPLSDPARLRSWLLELARGSALAWSGSPQARSVPVPHGVAPEELLLGAVVPAPASLRVGLARTFDRAATVAEAAASRRAAEASAFLAAGRSMVTPAHHHAPAADSTPAAGHEPAETPAMTDGDAAVTGSHPRYEPASIEAARPPAQRAPERDLPLMRVDEDGAEFAGPSTVVPLAPWRTRPAMAAAAVLAAAAVGLTAAMNWPASEPQLISESRIAVVSPSTPPAFARPSAAPAAPGGRTDSDRPTAAATVAGAYTSGAGPARHRVPHVIEPVARDVRRTPAVSAQGNGDTGGSAPASPASPTGPTSNGVRPPTTTSPGTATSTATPKTSTSVGIPAGGTPTGTTGPTPATPTTPGDVGAPPSPGTSTPTGTGTQPPTPGIGGGSTTGAPTPGTPTTGSTPAAGTTPPAGSGSTGSGSTGSGGAAATTTAPPSSGGTGGSGSTGSGSGTGGAGTGATPAAPTSPARVQPPIAV